MKHLVFLFALILLSNAPLFSQESPTVKEKKVVIIKTDESNQSDKNVWISKDGKQSVKERAIFIGQEDNSEEKDVSVNVNKSTKDGKEISTFEVTVKDGETTEVISWEDDGNGEIPTEVADQLKAHGLDIQLFQSADDKMTVTVDATNENQNEQEVEVNVEKEIKDGKEQRTVDITIGKEGETKKLKWVDNGVIPDEIRKTLNELGIDPNILDGDSFDGEYDIDIEKDGDSDQKEIKKVYKIELSEGEEISDELKEELEGYGVDIDQLIKEAKAKKDGDEPVMVKKKIKVAKGKSDSSEEQDIHIIKLKEGEELPEDVKELLKKHDIDIEKKGVTKEGAKKMRVMKIKDKEGKVKVLEWDGEGEMPAEMKKHMEGINNDGASLHMHKTKSANKAQFGVMIEESDKGVMVNGVIENSAAAKVGIDGGDIITHIDGSPVSDIESLLAGLSSKNPGDNVEVSFLRDNQKETVVATLTEPLVNEYGKIEKKVEIEIKN